MKKTLSTLVILLVVAGLAFGAYKYFIAKPAAPAGTDGGLSTTAGVATDPVTTATPDADVSSAANEFLTLLLSVQSIKLDDTLFANPSFTTLQDLSRPITPDTNPGRKNPFAPLGADGTSAVSTQVTTSNPSSIGATTSTLNGVLSIGDPSVTRWFEYGTTTALGTMTTPRTQANPGAFAEPLTGLTPATTYYVKAAASIGGQTVYGAQVTWKTATK